MPYTVVIRRQAQKKLQNLSRPDRARIAGDWRVIFDRHDAVRIIAIERIKPRGDAYK